MSKNLWRQGFLRCPAKCDISTKAVDDCRCSCPPEILGDLTSYDVLVNRTNIIYWLHQYSSTTETNGEWHIDGYTTDTEAEAWNELLEALCDPGLLAEYQNWVRHGDRLQLDGCVG